MAKRFSGCELFDEADLDAALARFDELSRPVPQLENAASQVCERFLAHFATGDWGAMAEILADNFCNEDRRRVVGAGVRSGRDAQIVDMRAIADLGITNVTSTVIANRGGRLVLMRVRFSFRDQGPEAFFTDFLGIVEANADDHIVALVSFDVDDTDAAFAELDARYVAGEAAAHAHAWSLIARNYAAFNRHEFPSAAPGWVTIDHRRGTSFEPGDLTAYIRSTWDTAPDTSTYIETVHRVSDLGAVFTQVSKGSSQQGFEAEWREICLLTADGETFNGCELFDEADLDAALARFDELDQPTPRLENAASQVTERFVACFAARDWTAMAELLAEDMSTDDRRRVVSTGLPHGRDTQIASMRAVADVGTTNLTSTVIATRGERLALSRAPLLWPRPAARGVLYRGTRRRGDQRRQPDRRRRSRSTPTTSTPPSRSSTPGTWQAKRPRTRTHGRSSRGRFAALNRHELTPDGVGLGQHRPPQRDRVHATGDCPHTSPPRGSMCRTQAFTSRLCIG